MDSLLRVASGVETAEAFNRVHAFNVLRLVFLDKELAVDTSAFFADGALILVASLAISWVQQWIKDLD